ncbi:gluconokinase [Limoniibacter endophyticus]|uniref:Gluconokinase n=1 Tax=Limoniibacter endophyticus TaxID=1565040 RepID=A0A8J3DRN9_9HYPH|nr:gluconokinase [Limoniibacter endophyticus]GHC75607.1 gluconokinase [Limoniibacter endophyticus]
MTLEYNFGHRLRVVVMGVSGCGKSSVGAALADALGLSYLEGDSLHPDENIEKMMQGVPLTDDDRWPWLDEIGEKLRNAPPPGLIASCSALKKSYRTRLRASAGDPLYFVYLHARRETLIERMQMRTGHFMPVSMLDSQLAALEPPLGEQDVVAVNVNQSLESVIKYAAAELKEIMRPS